MYLLLDFSEQGTIHLALFSGEVYHEVFVVAQNREALAVLDTYLTDRQALPVDIHGIMVVVGAGSFTNTRITATIANTFAYVYQIPLLAIHESDVSRVQTLIPVLCQQPRGVYISPTYSGEPNISSSQVRV